MIFDSVMAYLIAKATVERKSGEMTPFNRLSTWIYCATLNLLIALIPNIFLGFITVKICLALESSCSFLTEAHAPEQKIAKYKKLIFFTKFICVVFTIFCVLEVVSVGLFVTDQLLACDKTIPIHLFIPKMHKVMIARLVVDVLKSFKHCFIPIVYLWVG